MKKCETCKYFKDFRSFDLGFRCFNSKNSPIAGDFKEIPSMDYSCEHYIEFKIADLFEWDDNKNRQNITKHGISFEAVYAIFFDSNNLQAVVEKHKWEKIDEEKFEELGIEKNQGNLDPIRGKIIGKYQDKIYTVIYTFRGAFDGDVKFRIISLRRANNNELKLYNREL